MNRHTANRPALDRLRAMSNAESASDPDATRITGTPGGSGTVDPDATRIHPAMPSKPRMKHAARRHAIRDAADDATIVSDATRVSSGKGSLPGAGTPSSAGTPLPTVIPTNAVGAPTDAELHAFRQTFDLLTDAVGSVVVGKERAVRHCLLALLAGGHLLLEDVPGTGKTLLARTLARAVDVSFRRIQFTPDLLPGDVTGVTVLERASGTFTFREGPVFASIVLADEINRASPKTQSALLEVMEEGHVTVDGVAHAVPTPFMVVATQNPSDQIGTYRLPEAQLDRFMLSTSIGHPSREASLDILRGDGVRKRMQALTPVVDAVRLASLRGIASRVHCDDRVLAYIVRLVEGTRHRDALAAGASIRGALSLLRCARVLAAAEGRAYVTPSDVSALAAPALVHRVTLGTAASFDGVSAADVIAALVHDVPAPTGEAS